MNEASQYLLTLAKRNAQVYTSLPNIKAIMLTGSAAEGISDFYSDIDMILYYDKLPPEEALLAACRQNQGTDRRLLGDRNEGALIDVYQVHGVECQCEHTTIATWEHDIASVLEQLDVITPTQKALSGVLTAIPLYGEALIRDWQAQLANYPDTLAQAMVKHHLTIFPLWGIQDRMTTRDATIWHYQLLVEGAYNILGILAGLNHLYYSSFQFKRMHHFIVQMNIAPAALAHRLEIIFHTDATTAAIQLEELISETVALVEQHMPAIDTASFKEAHRMASTGMETRSVSPCSHPRCAKSTYRASTTVSLFKSCTANPTSFSISLPVLPVA